MESQKMHFQGPTYGRMRCSGKILEGCLRFLVSHLHSSHCGVKKVQPCIFIKPRRKSRVQKLCAIGLVHDKVYSSSAFVPAQLVKLLFPVELQLVLHYCIQACSWRQHLEPTLGAYTWSSPADVPQAAASPRGCYGEREHMNTWTHKCVLPWGESAEREKERALAFVKLGLYYIRLGKHQVLFQNN